MLFSGLMAMIIWACATSLQLGTASRLPDEGGEMAGGALLVTRHGVRVDRHRDGGAGMPEPLAHGLDWLPIGQQEAGMGVPHPVQASR